MATQDANHNSAALQLIIQSHDVLEIYIGLLHTYVFSDFVSTQDSL